MNFVINKGDIISLSADSGKGKSTIINLLCRLYDVDSTQGCSGEILINGTNIKDIELETLRQQISVVPQAIILFNASLKSNIILDEKYDKKRLMMLAKMLKLPDLNMNGQKCSQGQKQRVLIARTLYNTKKSVYIFDESLSAIDLPTAKKIHSYILNFLKKNNKTGIFISHNKNFENKSGRIIKI
jgi:ABC-type multidrug transport system fused ATPase/permease subunit